MGKVRNRNSNSSAIDQRLTEETILVSLEDLPTNGEGIVVSVEAPQPLAHRLFSLGLLPGAKVKKIRSAPLGDPIEFQVGDFLLALRAKDASRVLVHPLSDGTAPKKVDLS
ncbi:MAG: ferrous iron transport protein A [Armatimonadetes bacterium]|nr:ferrous iron transport protein A [Armatimonadota bacterium]MDW8121489.1 FeoA family protein [Armatimonadota bacterium]